jgi:tRNA(Ile)-lysidine synthase
MTDSLDLVVARALEGRPAVLAVSGGRDSMALMHAALAGARGAVACVATFDHGTGAHAAAAAALVARAGAALGVEVVSERAARPGRSEAEWRAQRWGFLRRLAAERGAAVATAHTRDDQVETVLMRVMRGSGARGLAALAAEGAVVRPLLRLPRAVVASYAARAGLSWVDDPSNASRAHLRNRVRLDLLPALARARPALAKELIATADRAARLRADVDAFIDRALAPRVGPGTVCVAREFMMQHDRSALSLLWPAIAARAGAMLDRRGTVRLAAFTTEGGNGARIPLSGGFEVVIHRGLMIVRASPARGTGMELPLATGIQLGGFRFRTAPSHETSLWSARLPAERCLTVREWRPGDRMVPAGGRTRRVKGLLRDAGVDAASRAAWPVVLVDDEIVWIPGVRRSAAASARSGRPVVTYHCERLREPVDR